jgi:hypothetical protein
MQMLHVMWATCLSDEEVEASKFLQPTNFVFYISTVISMQRLYCTYITQKMPHKVSEGQKAKKCKKKMSD